MFSKAKNGQTGDAGPVDGGAEGETARDKASNRADTAKPARLSAAQARRNNGKTGPSVPSLISSDVVIKGSIEAEGEVQFDGALEGDITAKGLVVGEGAVIHGEVTAEKARISGTVEGTIRASRIDLSATAVVKGEIIHTALSIENGARFEGNCRHSDDPMSNDGTRRSAPGRQGEPAPQKSAAEKPAGRSDDETARGRGQMASADTAAASMAHSAIAQNAANAASDEAETAGPDAGSDGAAETAARKPVLKSVPNPDREKSTSTASFLNRGGKADLR